MRTTTPSVCGRRLLIWRSDETHDCLELVGHPGVDALMAGTFLRRPLSASTNGRGIKVAASSSVGTTIHTAQSGTTLVDVITLFAYNSDTVTRRLTLEWGGTTSPDDNLVFDIPPKSTVPIVMDLVLRNSLLVTAFADAANVVAINGFINTES